MGEVKYKPGSPVECFKAHLATKGYTQVDGVDYVHTFLPIVKLTKVYVLLTLAVGKNWFAHQVDVNNAFLFGFLNKKIYMTLSPSYHKPLSN